MEDGGRLKNGKIILLTGLTNRSFELDFWESLSDLMYRTESPFKVLRHLCIYSFVKGGLPSKRLDLFRREFIQTYGSQHIITFQNLFQAGLLQKYESSKNSYGTLIKTLNLITDYESSLTHQNIASIYAGYAPISVRLIEIAGESYVGKNADGPPPPLTWGKKADILKAVPGEAFEETWFTSLPMRASNNPSTLVVYIGGITLAEMSAIRHLSQTTGIVHANIGRNFTVLTTQIISAERIFSSLMEP